jgi:predicted glycoside hydrolase/deacetylase ChbG (UPF0249 family)
MASVLCADHASPRRIWLCADDYAISPSVDRAIRDLIVRGRLNATTVMVAAPTFQRDEATALAILNSECKRVAIGLHVTLTAPFRPLSKGFRPLHEGAFLALAATFRAGLLGRFSHEQLGAEIAAQIKAFKGAFGHPPDFIDGHQHVHLFPQIRDAVVAVVKEGAPDAWVRQCGRALPLLSRIDDGKSLFLDRLSRTFRRRAHEHGLKTNPAFAGTYTYRHDANFAALFPSFLEALPENSVVMCHPGFVDVELARLDPLTSLREREYAYLASDQFPRVLERHGVTLA